MGFRHWNFFFFYQIKRKIKRNFIQVLQRKVRSQHILNEWNAFNTCIKKTYSILSKTSIETEELNFSSIQSLVNSRVGILGNKRPTQRIVSDIWGLAEGILSLVLTCTFHVHVLKWKVVKLCRKLQKKLNSICNLIGTKDTYIFW